MAGATEISWTDSTFNPWIGCTNVSAGCDHCYAETMNAHRKWTEWGPHGERRLTADSTWRNPEKWQKLAPHFHDQFGRRRRVFCASLADVFDNRAPAGARERLFALIRSTPSLDWQLLTKRPENMRRFLPRDWGGGYPNVWLGTTTEDQEAYDRRWPVLQQTPAAVRFISYEPAIGPVRFTNDPRDMTERPDWVICGGESGPGARPMNPAWARGIRDDCRDYGAAFFHKQWGDYQSNPWVVEKGVTAATAARHDPATNGKGGGLLDGRLHRAFPPTKHETDVAHARAGLARGAPLQGDLGF